MFNYDRMEKLVKLTGISKAHLCRLLDKSPYYFRDAKKAKTNIPIENVRIIAEALHTTPEYLTEETDDPELPQSPTLTDDEIKAAFWGGEKDLTQADIDDLFQDAKDYIAFKTAQRKGLKKNDGIG